METNKRNLLDNAKVTDQLSLVKALLPKNKREPVKFVIPGGKNLLNNLDERILEKAINTWLRFAREFNWVTISMVADPEAIQVTERKVEDFSTKDGILWERPNTGKAGLAAILARHLIANKCVSITAKADGIYLALPKKEEELSPTNENWEPCVLFDKKFKNEYAIY